MKVARLEHLHADAGKGVLDFLKLTTDDGGVGWSEYNETFGGAGVTAAIDGLAPLVIGRDPRAREAIVTTLYAVRRQAPGGVIQQAIAAIENAMLDVKARALGIPVYEMLGGPDVVEQLLEMTDGLGADYTFEATGNVNVMRQAVESARMGWGLATVCGVAGKGETLDVVPRFLITGRRVAGSSFGGVKGRDGVPRLVDMWLAGKIDVDPFISHHITLDEVNRGFELMEAQDGIRSVIVFPS